MSIANYGELKAAVENSLPRSIPAFVYSLSSAELSNRLRLREMEATATLATVAATETVTLPVDYAEAIHAYLDVTPRQPLDLVGEFGANARHGVQGRPSMAVVTKTTMILSPTPDGVYSVKLRYYARLAAFVDDADTNDVLSEYPALYLYASLKHAAMWGQDRELAESYAAILEGEIRRVERADEDARFGAGPLRSVPVTVA